VGTDSSGQPTKGKRGAGPETGTPFWVFAYGIKAINPMSEPMSDSNSSKLDTLETSGDSRPPESYRKYCITHCQDEYEATLQTYREFDLEDGTDRATTFLGCRTGAWFARNKLTGMVKVLSSSCHLRWCPMCSATRRWFLTQQVSDWLRSALEPKFLTLTVVHNSNLLSEQIEFLYDSFKKYRKLNLLKRNVKGGVWFFQIHKSKHDNKWHPHLHCVIDSPWIDKYELSTAWKLVTKTSEIIHIKEVKDSDSMSEYVARYAARPSLMSKLDFAGRFELLRSLHGRRLVGTWGCARSIVLRPSRPPDADNWENIGSFAKVTDSVDSNPKALKIWQAFKNGTECPEDCNLLHDSDKANCVQYSDVHTVDEHRQMLLDFY